MAVQIVCLATRRAGALPNIRDTPDSNDFAEIWELKIEWGLKLRTVAIGYATAAAGGSNRVCATVRTVRVLYALKDKLHSEL